jgi:ERCC4-type nuclease
MSEGPIIVVDTREQLPLTLPNSRLATLATGDYSVAGYEQLISIERKSLSDLFGCVGQGRERFERCLERLATYKYPAIVIEATFADILSGVRHSQIHPNSAIGSLVAWATRYRIPCWLCGDRAGAATVTHRILTKAVKYVDEAVMGI